MPSTPLKLMAALAALTLLVMGTTGLFADRGLRAREMQRIARSLEEEAGLVRELIGPAELAAPSPQLDDLADRAAAAAGVRVTLIGPGGVVVGDSDVSFERLARVENHADRPEVREALAGRVGRDERLSDTVGRRLLYLAVPAGGSSGGAVRLAEDLSGVEAAAGELRRQLLAAGAIGLLAALGLGYGLSWVTLKPIRELRRAVESLASGDLATRLPLRWRDELGLISSGINQVADQLRQRLADATAEKERLQAVLNGMSDGVLVVDAGGRIVLANDPLRKIYGVWGEVRARTPLAAIRNAELDEILREAARRDEPVLRRVELARPAPRSLRVHAVRFPPGPGPHIGTVAVLHDVTEIAKLDQVRRDFVANASHELRTPLAAIRGFAETLLSGGALSEDERRNYIEIIDRHARRLSNLVADLLQLSKTEAREARFELSALDLDELVGTLIRDSAPRFEEKRLDVQKAGSAPAPVWADPQAVEQVLTNLIDNAVQYTDAGGRIEVAIEPLEDEVRVSVRDTGIGIPAEDLGRIFERFYRVDKARSRAMGGTGLGLSIVKHLVQKLGGEVWVESEVGRGSTFSFTLPLAPRGRRSSAA